MKQGGNTPLMTAAEMGHLRIVSFLLSSGAWVNAENNKGETALIKAIRRGHTAIAKELLLYGARPNPSNAIITPKSLASDLHQNDVLSALSKAIAHINDSMCDMFCSYLPKNCHLRNFTPDEISLFPVQLFDPFYETNFAINFKISPQVDITQNGPLLLVICAVMFDSETSELTHCPDKSLQFITSVSLDHTQVHCRETILFPETTTNGPTGIRTYHVQKKFEPNTPNLFSIKSSLSLQRSVAPLLLVGLFQAELQKEAIKKISTEFQLLKKQQRCDAFKHTCATGSTRIVSALLNYVSPDELETPEYASCLHLACQNGFLDVVELLVKNGSNIEAEYQGDTPLMVAAEMGHLSVTSYLLSSGAFVNFKNNRRETALLKAIKKGNVAIVKELLLYGARFDSERSTDLIKVAESLQLHDVISELGVTSSKLDSSLSLIFKSYLHEGCEIQANPVNSSRNSLFPVHLINPNYETDFILTFRPCSEKPSPGSNSLDMVVICCVQFESGMGKLFHCPQAMLDFMSVESPKNKLRECFPFKKKFCGIRLLRNCIRLELSEMEDLRFKSSKPIDRNSKHPLLLVGMFRIEIHVDSKPSLKEVNQVIMPQLAAIEKIKKNKEEKKQAKSRISHSNKENEKHHEENAIRVCVDHSNEGIDSVFCTETNCFLKEYCTRRANFRKTKRSLYKKLLEFGIDMIYEGENNSRRDFDLIDKRRFFKSKVLVCEDHMLFGMDSIKCVEDNCFLKKLPNLEFDLRLLRRQLSRKLADAGIHIN